MLSSQLTHYDSCSKDLFEKPALYSSTLARACQSGQAYIHSDDGNQDDKRSNVRGFCSRQSVGVSLDHAACLQESGGPW